jgi:kumamolisin
MPDFVVSSFVPLSGSDRGPLADVQTAQPLDGAERIEVTLVTRRRTELPSEYEQLAERHGADPADVARIREVFSTYGFIA